MSSSVEAGITNSWEGGGLNEDNGDEGESEDYAFCLSYIFLVAVCVSSLILECLKIKNQLILGEKKEILGEKRKKKVMNDKGRGWGYSLVVNKYKQILENLKEG